ncbi:hypothetical protein PENSTE_c014G09114 [Penicillium steckii]|uniref:Ubiquitin 3 binding protein But2 C-terminal domain-containing protein n=1 Tax=Penicillium steckii TaxID=303698 RepID=A0A1V6T1N0_9EURO|nr:hypothetical protein PENSTE_c014G09114 [Penicillium steckii]
MKFSEIITLSAALATSASANPMKRSTNVPDYADITFVAADNSFSQSFPTDGSVVDISNVLSVSSISSSTNGITCTFNGVDGSVTSVSGAQSADVGPPQTQVSGHCSKLWRRSQPQRRDSVAVTFEGAADAEFQQYFPTDGTPTKIWNPLSISHIEVERDGVSCTFKGIDDSVTYVTGPSTVDVGPPQTQIEGTCTA